MTPAYNRMPLTSAALRIVRGSMLAFVLMLGGIIWYLRSTDPPTPADAQVVRTLRIVFLVLLVIDIPLIMRMRTLQARAERFEAAARLTITGWALAEGIALFGGVLFLLTADPLMYLAGTGVLLGAFLMLPVPEPAQHG